jgi:hypothetical protein
MSNKPQASLRILRLCERDNWICWICGGNITLPIDPVAPNAPSRDHVVPKSRLKKMKLPSKMKDRDFHDFNGANIRLAHRWCNSHRQSKAITALDKAEFVQRLAEAMEEYELEKTTRELLSESK